MAAILNLSTFKHVPFLQQVVVIGSDYSGSALKMQVRNQPGDSGLALVELSEADAGLQGVSVEYDEAYLFVMNGVEQTAPASIFTIQINEETIESLSLNNPKESDLKLTYDLHATPAGGLKRVLFGGDFVISPGTTI